MNRTRRQLPVLAAALLGVAACAEHSGATVAPAPTVSAGRPTSRPDPAPTPRPTAQPQMQATQGDARATISVEVVCSSTRLRTTNARVRWNVAGPVVAGAAALAATRPSLELTVYDNGFAKGLSATLPIEPAATPDNPIVARQAANRPALRAYQVRIIEVEQPRALAEAQGGGAAMGVVVEGLEPGMNYTWRLNLETPGGRVVSPEVTVQALVCPADMVPDTAPPVRRP